MTTHDMPNSIRAMELEVGRLMAERASLSRFRLELPPDKLMLLRRLVTRLGWLNVKLQKKQYARLTLSPPRNFRGPMGENMQEHDYTDESGKKLGVVRVQPRNDGEHLHIHWIGPATDVAAGEVSNTVGNEGMRSLLPQLKASYPGAKFISGVRAGGFRKDKPERVVRELKRLPIKVIKYAKVDGDVKPHHLIKGFAIEHALRHLANDPKNSDTIRTLAKHALTGKTLDGKVEHPGPALWMLHDALNDYVNEDGTVGHPLRSPESGGYGYRWMNAADKVDLDAKTHLALTEIANESKVGVPTNRHNDWEYSSESHAARAYRGMRKGNARRDLGLAASRALLHRVQARVRELHPTVEPHLIDESIRRHAHRGDRSYLERFGNSGSHYQEQAVNPVKEHLDPDYTKTVHATRYQKKVIPVKVIKYAGLNIHSGNFLDALRRIRSTNQNALKASANKVARKLGLHPTKILDALYDAPHGSTPGITQAVYGNASPEQIHSAASWLGLTGNLPGVAVFHPRLQGPDVLWKFKYEGSGMDLRQRLDRFGITNRVLIPNKRGFSVLVPDKGNVLSKNMQAYFETHKTPFESSKGHFHTLGSLDQGQARDQFRDTVVKEESKKQSRKYAMKYEGPTPLFSWIDPHGNLHPVGRTNGHLQWMIDQGYIPDEEDETSHNILKGVHSMMEKGWHRVLRSGNDLVVNNSKVPPTSKQRSVLKDLAIEHKLGRLIHDNDKDYRTIWTNPDSGTQMSRRK